MKRALILVLAVMLAGAVSVEAKKDNAPKEKRPDKAARKAAKKKEKPAKDGKGKLLPECYIKKATWLESWVASREKLVQEAGFAARDPNNAGSTLPQTVRVSNPMKRMEYGKTCDFTLKADVAGLDKIFVQLAAPQNSFHIKKLSKPGNRIVFIRATGADGSVAELEIPKGNLSAGKPVELPLEGGRKFQALEIGFSIFHDGMFVTLDSKDRAIDTKRYEDTLRTIMDSVRADFRDPESTRQFTGEVLAGIWDYDWTAGDAAKIQQARKLHYQAKTKEHLALTKKTLEYVGKSATRADFQPLEKKFQALEKELQSLEPIVAYEKLCTLRREILFSHPDLSFEKLVVNRHAPGAYSHNCDQYLGRHSRPGPGLTILENWKSAPKAIPMLENKLPVGDTAHPVLSWDAKRIIFGFCDHTPEDTSERRFHIFEAAVDGSQVKQLTGTKDDPMEGWCGRDYVGVEDFDPFYLPDGGFVFTSTRSQNFGRCHGGRYTPSYLLYRADAGAKNIRQISWGEANEHYPSVLNDGRIVYTRWEYISRNEIAFHKLWWCRPDGTQPSNFYGNNSATPWGYNFSDRQVDWYDDHPDRHRFLPYMISETRAIPGSRKVVAVATAHHSYTAGSLVLIDPDKGEDWWEPISKLTPETPYPEAEDLFVTPGHYKTPMPVNEDLYFTAYSPYTVIKQSGPPKINDYAIYLIDSFGGREPIFRDPEISTLAPMPLRPTKKPPVIPSTLPENAPDEGTLVLQNVYLTQNDPEGVIKPGDIKALRLIEVINLPTNQGKTSPGPTKNGFCRRILGTVPVQEDGSAIFKVPARTPFHLQALDKNGMALITERSFNYLQPGENRSCIGCHEKPGSVPPMKFSAMQIAPAKITPPAGPRYEGGFSFLRTVQPVLDRHCIKCHGLKDGKEQAGKLSLLGTPLSGSKRIESHSALISREGLVAFTQRKSAGSPDAETVSSVAKDYYAHAGKLAHMLLEGHKGVKLDKDEFSCIVDWLDINAPCFETYVIKDRVGTAPLDQAGETVLREHIRATLGDELAGQPIAALVNAAEPEQSRILKAPLAKSSSGWEQISNGWKSTDDNGYRKMAALVWGAIGQKVDIATAK